MNFDGEEYFAFCDVCGVGLLEDECYIVRDFFDEGDDGHFCYIHYEELGYASSDIED